MGTIVEGLIFDLDNTLLDRQAVFLRFAGDFYEEHLRTTISNTRDDAVAKMVGWDEDGYISREKMFVRWIAEWPEVGLEVGPLERLYRSGMERQALPDPEVNGYLAYLNEQQVPWGIVTNGSRNQRRMCRAAGLDELAPFIIVSEEAGYAKPDPRIFRDALRATGLTRPEQVMFVGDNPLADIDGAKRFGMKAAWIRRGRRYPSNLHPPDHVVDLATEVRGVVDVAGRSGCRG